MNLILGDCLTVFKNFPDNYVDSIVTDPPAGISFMGKKWDDDKGGREQWITWMSSVACECQRVLKPGGHAFVWALPRTSHWTATAWENAGWEVRDRVAHLFGTGFPKNLDVGKAIDKAAKAEREVIAETATKCGVFAHSGNGTPQDIDSYTHRITAPATDEAKQWDGWGTALKPATEDWWLFRKPLSEDTVAANVLKWGTGALNIDACRVGSEAMKVTASDGTFKSSNLAMAAPNTGRIDLGTKTGRWPANVVHDDSDEVLFYFPSTKTGNLNRVNGSGVGYRFKGQNEIEHIGDEGSAARFFYAAKASVSERETGLPNVNDDAGNRIRQCTHPTVKPIALMRYLCRLITPPGGIVLDPFLGSGSTGVAAKAEGFAFIGIEKEPEYFEIARHRNDAIVARV